MKNNGQEKQTLLGVMGAALAAVLLSVIPSAAHADLASAGINLGKAKNYVILGTEQGISLGKGLENQTDVFGDVGLFGSELTLSNDVVVHGTAFYSSNANTPVNIQPGSSITGGAQTSTTIRNDLQSAVNSAKTASQTAAAKKASAGYASNYEIKSNITLSGSGNVVLNLGNFIVRNNATLTLTGTASTSYVINISKQFILTMGHIVLSGGLTADNVLFNIGSGIETASIIKGSSFQGTLLAVNSRIEVADGSTVRGRLIGKKIVLSGSTPPVVSP